MPQLISIYTAEGGKSKINCMCLKRVFGEKI
jgi:hypothetical protein